MKINLYKAVLFLFFSLQTFAEVSGSFIVKGDIDKFYPVTFFDGGRGYHVGTELKIGRSNVHEDASWRGSLIANIQFHVTAWGNGSNFINAEIVPSSTGLNTTFIAGWRDATSGNSSGCIIIWMRGGSTTYHYQSNYAVNPTVYDGVQNVLPYNEAGGPAHTFKTALDTYVSATGIYQNRNAYFMSKVGIGTTSPDSKLTVNGDIHAKEVKVDLSIPVPDYVFANDYKLKTLPEVEAYIKQNNHLPEIPSAQEIEKNGLMLAEMNMALLKKIEEITLYMIELKKENEKQNTKIKVLENKLKTNCNNEK